MGEKSDAKLIYSIDGKEFEELTKIPSLTDDAELVNIPSNMDWFEQPQEMTVSFTSNINPLVLLGILLDQETLTRYCQPTKSNNWRKRHGLPMRRRLTNVSGYI